MVVFIPPILPCYLAAP